MSHHPRIDDVPHRTSPVHAGGHSIAAVADDRCAADPSSNTGEPRPFFDVPALVRAATDDSARIDRTAAVRTGPEPEGVDTAMAVNISDPREMSGAEVTG